MHQVESLSNRLLVALSTADSNKWLLLKEGHLEKQAPEVITSSDYRLNGSIRQRQRRLTEAQVADMTSKYEAGATVYELAAEFGCHRATVSERVKKAGIVMRGQSPTPDVIDSMVCLYESGLSYQEVGKKLGLGANTVRNCLRERRIRARDNSCRDRCVFKESGPTTTRVTSGDTSVRATSTIAQYVASGHAVAFR
jgi:transposase-like protein